MGINSNDKGLDKLFPIATMIGCEEENTFRVIKAVGLRQEGNRSAIAFAAAGGRNSISYIRTDVPVRTAFNVLSQARMNGEVADLTDKTIEEKGLGYKSPEGQGFIARLLG